MLHLNTTTPVTPARAVFLGKNGFLASHTARLFIRSGIPVRQISSEEINLAQLGAGKKLKMLLLPTDVVLHFAAITPDKKIGADISKQNIEIGFQVAEAIQGAPPSQLIYISSDTVYPLGVEGITEMTPCSPSDDYSHMHYNRENLYHQICHALSIPCVRLRPCAVYGEGDTHRSYGVSRFIESAIVQRQIHLFGKGEEKRDHLSVRDASTLLLLLALHRANGVLNGISGYSYTFREIAQNILKSIPHQVTIIENERTLPMLHKTYNPALIQKLFPQFRPHALSQELDDLVLFFKKQLKYE